MPVKKGKNCVGDEMSRWKAGNLHSGENGPVVKSRKQALAIAISECKHSERLQSLGFSEEVADRVAEMLDFSNSNLDWAKQFEDGVGPGKNTHPDVGPADRKHPKELVPKGGNLPKQEEPEMLSPVSYPKQKANWGNPPSKQLNGMQMLG
jgi:hypothetical protein